MLRMEQIKNVTDNANIPNVLSVANVADIKNVDESPSRTPAKLAFTVALNGTFALARGSVESTRQARVDDKSQ